MLTFHQAIDPSNTKFPQIELVLLLEKVVKLSFHYNKEQHARSLLPRIRLLICHFLIVYLLLLGLMSVLIWLGVYLMKSSIKLYKSNSLKINVIFYFTSLIQVLDHLWAFRLIHMGLLEQCLMGNSRVIRPKLIRQE